MKRNYKMFLVTCVIAVILSLVVGSSALAASRKAEQLNTVNHNSNNINSGISCYNNEYCDNSNCLIYDNGKIIHTQLCNSYQNCVVYNGTDYTHNQQCTNNHTFTYSDNQPNNNRQHCNSNARNYRHNSNSHHNR